MHDLTDNEERQVLGELLKDKLDVILEYVSDIPAIKKDVHRLKVDVDELKTDVKVIKAVVREHDVDIQWLKTKVA